MPLHVQTLTASGGHDTGTTRAITVGSGANRMLEVHVMDWVIAAVTGVSSSVDGAFTKVGSNAVTAVGGGGVSKWRLLNPTTGAHTISVSYSDSNSETPTSLVVSEYTDVHQTTPYGTPVTANGDSSTPSVTATTASGELVTDGVMSYVDQTSEGANQTLRGNAFSGVHAHTSEQAGADGGVMSWNQSEAGEWAIIAASMKPVGGTIYELAPSVAGQATTTPTLYAVVELGGGEVAGSASVSAAMKVVREVEVSVGSVAGAADVAVSLAAVRGLGASSNLCPEGGFDRPSVNWTLGANWQIADGVASQTAPALSSIRYTITAVVGATYHIQYTVTNETAGGSLVAGIGGVAGTSRAGNGTFTDTIVATTAGQLLFTASGTWDGDLDDVIVRQVGTASVSSAAVRELEASVGGEAAMDVAISGVRVTEHDATVEGVAEVTVSVGVLRVFGATVAGTSTTSSGVSGSSSVTATVEAAAETSIAALSVRRGLVVGVDAGATVTVDPAYTWAYDLAVSGLSTASARMLPNYGVTYDGLYAVEHALAYQLVKAASETEAFD